MNDKAELDVELDDILNEASRMSTCELPNCRLCRKIILKPDSFNKDHLCGECERYIAQSNKLAELEGRIKNANDIMEMVIKHGQNVHLWDLEALILTELVERKTANSTQINDYNAMITERRAEIIMTDICTSLISQYRFELNQLKEKEELYERHQI